MLRSGGSSAGLSLVEALVAGFLAALAFYVLLTLLIPTVRLSALGTVRVDLDQRGAVLTQHLVTALGRTTRAGVGFTTLGPTKLLSTHALTGAVAGSRPSWSDHLTVFVWRDQKLQKRELPLSSAPLRATVLPLTEVESGLGESRLRLEVRQVQEFEATVGDGPRVDFRIVLAKDKDVLTLERTVYLANSSQ